MDENLLGRPARHLPSSALSSGGPEAESANASLSPYLGQNFAALAENASLPVYVNAAPAPDSGPEIDADGHASPDDFYRTYNGLTPSAGRSHTDATTAAGPYPSSSMATTLPRTRGMRAPLRPNERAAVLAAASSSSSPSRSASSPAHRRSPTKPTTTAATPSGLHTKRSVKDLTKQFDRAERAGPPPRPSARRPTATSAVPPLTTSTTNTRNAHPRTNGQIPYATLRSTAHVGAPVGGPGRAKGPGSNVSQRPKFVAEDQYSNNAQSFASRVAKSPSPAKSPSVARSPSAATATSYGSRSASHLSPQTPRRPSTADQLPAKPPLFGEVMPHDRDKLTVGYGIENVRPRRTSESGIIRPRLEDAGAANRNAELYRVDWYSNHDANGIETNYGVEDEHVQEVYGGDDNETEAGLDGAVEQREQHEQHEQHDDDPETVRMVPEPVQDVKPKPTIRSSTRPRKTSAPPLSATRLPLPSSRKVTSPEVPDIPTRTSSRATSPALVKRAAPSPRSATAGADASTSTSTSTSTRTIAATATAATSPRRPPPLGIPVPASNGSGSNANMAENMTEGDNGSSLQAYIASPPPKLSPPLRSSRPRLPVSAASTASSRSRQVAGRANLPKPKPSSRAPSRTDEPVSPRTSIEAPINFAERRQHIRLKYTMSVRDNASALRATERKRKEIEAAKTNNNGRNGPVAGASAARLHDLSDNVVDSPTLGQGPSIDLAFSAPTRRRKHSLTHQQQQLQQQQLQLQQQQQQEKDAKPKVEEQHQDQTFDLPGSFPFTVPPAPNDDSSASAVSTPSSGGTQFDNEPQTEPPLPSSHGTSTLVEPSHPILQAPSAPSPPAAEYRSPFDEEVSDDDDDVVDGARTADGDVSPVSPAPNDDDDRDMFVSEGSQDEYEPMPFAHPPTQSKIQTKVTILRRQSDASPFLGAAQGPLPMLTSTAAETPVSPIGQGQFDDGFEFPPRHSTSNDAVGGREREGADRENPNAPDGLPAVVARRDPPRRDPLLAEKIALFRQSYASDMSDGTALEALRHALIQGRAVAEGQGRSPPESPQSGLLVPRVHDRLSQNTAWTDVSVHSGGRPGYPEPPRSMSAAPVLGSRGPSHMPAEEERGIPSAPPPKTPAWSPGAAQQDAALSGQRSDVFSPRQHRHFELDMRHYDGSPSYPAPAPAHGTSTPPPRVPVSVRDHSPPLVPPNRLSGSVFDSRRTSAALEFYETGLHGNTAAYTSSEDASLDSRLPSMDSRLPSMDQSFTLVSQPTSGPESEPLNNNKTSASIELGREKSEAASKERHRLSQRRLVLKELIDTEGVFVSDMNIVEEIYKGTAEACPELDPQTIKLVFRNTDEIIAFHTSFLVQLKEAAASVYSPPAKRRRPPSIRVDSAVSEPTAVSAASEDAPPAAEPDDALDRATALGPVFLANMDKMKAVHEGFLRNSDQAAKRLIQIQKEGRVHIWLKECNEVAKGLTTAWNLDSLLIKPMQRITKYPTIMATLLQHTPQGHPDREALVAAKVSLETAIIEINKTKKNFELVGQIVGRKRKESDAKAGFARAFGKRVDRLQATAGGNRPPEDQAYQKLQERFGDDYLRLQVVLRDVEYYTRSVAEWVTSFMNYLSSIELVMRIQSGAYPELEAKWVQFNVSMREIEKVALDRHLSQVRKQVIEPFEQVIKAYGNPSLAMKKRSKRRVDFEKAEQLKKAGKAPDAKLRELVEQYEALNDTLKKELPLLSDKTIRIGHMCLGSFVAIQTSWFLLWRDKVRVVLAGAEAIPDVRDIVAAYHADFRYIEEHAATIGILNHGRARTSQSSTVQSSSSAAPSIDESLLRVRGLSNVRGRGLSLPGQHANNNSNSNVNTVGINIGIGDTPPSIPTPDFAKRHSGQFTLSPTTNFAAAHYYQHQQHQQHQQHHQHHQQYQHYHHRDHYGSPGLNANANASANANATLSPSNGSIHTPGAARPSTERSFDSGQLPRQSFESGPQARRDSGSTFNSNGNNNNNYYPTTDTRRYSGLFRSALPPDSVTDESMRSSRASSRDGRSRDGYTILWLAASLFEFNIDTTKHEAGYPYLTYQAGEIFDVIAEKGELWLARNQDNPSDGVGWIWSKHFAKLADS